jgi:hypothetical protein
MRTILSMAVLLLAPALAQAQTPLVSGGDRVRLLAVGGYRADGTVDHATADSISVLSEATGRFTLPYEALRRLEVLRPTTSTVSALRRGLLFGAAAGVLIASGAAAISSEGSISVGTSLPIIGVTSALGAATGMLLLRRNVWVSVALPGVIR